MHPNVRTTNRQNGSIVIANTNAVTGEFVAIDVLEATEFDTVVGNCTGLDGETVPAGMTIDGLFTSIQLTSGTVIAYRK
jgi:hypothetical protein